MIAAYLNTHRENGIQTRTSFARLISHSLSHSKPKITVAKDKTRNLALDLSLPLLFFALLLFLGSLFYSFPLPLNFRSVAHRNLFQWTFLPTSFIFTYYPTICVPIRSSLHLGYCCYYVRINKRFVIPFLFIDVAAFFHHSSFVYSVVSADECFTNSSSFFIIFFL